MRTLAPYPDATLVDVLADAARRHPERAVARFKGASLRYDALERLSDACAAGLAGLGVGRGDRVALVLPNCPQFLIAQFGAWKAGATVVPLNPTYTPPEMASALRSTGCRAAVTLTLFYERLKSVQSGTGVERVVTTGIKEYLPAALRVLFTLLKERKEGHRVTLREGDQRLGDLLRRHAASPPPKERARPDDVAFILMSGGTTGTPKGVVCPHRGVVATGIQGRDWVAPVLEEGRNVLLLPLPLFHAAAGILAQSTFLTLGGTLVLVPNPRDLRDLLASVARERPRFFGGVPTLYAAILNHPWVQAGKVDFRSVRLCMCGAAPLMAETKRRFEALTGARIAELYSLTEALVAPFANPSASAGKAGSVGLPAADVEVRVCDPETGEDVPTGQAGEVLLRAPQVMPGYWNDPEESAIALRDHGPRGRWLHTGDLGYLDDEGYLFLVDRMKDLIKPGGLQVWPREVEEALALHPAVLEAGVAGVPDPVKGEAVMAWVVARPGVRVTPDELRTHCKAHLAPYKVPARIRLRAELPKSLVGKVLRRALAAEARAEAAAADPPRT